MQLDRAFGAAESRPVEHAGAQIDHRRVHTDQLVFEAELASPQIAAPPTPGIGSTAAGIALRITATDGARWRRPRWSAQVPAATLNAAASPHWPPVRRKFRAATWPRPVGRTAWRRTVPNC